MHRTGSRKSGLLFLMPPYWSLMTTLLMEPVGYWMNWRLGIRNSR